MRRDEVIARLKKAEPEIRSFGVGSLYLFGSVARDEAGTDSDIDIFVEPEAASFYDLGNYMGAYDRLRSAFPEIRIGYSTRDGLSKHIVREAERDAVQAF